MQIVVHYAEIGLKGRNRPRFENRLLGNLESALHPLGVIRTRKLFGRLLVEIPDSKPFEEASRRIGCVFGVAWFGRATLCDPTMEAIERACDDMLRGRSFESFGVRARRPDKTHAFRSREIESRIGGRIQASTGARVDLGNPELWVEIHALSREAVVFCERIPGLGGLPVGISGKVVSLISGGIDSPVAAYLALKRGCRVAFAHFHSSPYTSAASQDKVRDLVARLGRFGGRAVLYTVPFGDLQTRLVRETPADPRIVLYRRFMIRLAERIAARERALALVTGECVGQVSSQTLANLDTINRAATLPVFRPLIGMDKAEIIALAKQVGTYDISIEPDEDCCSYLMPHRPDTWTRPERLDSIESRLDVADMVDTALGGVVREKIEPAT